MIRRVLTLALIVVAAVVWYGTLPPRPLALPVTAATQTGPRGAIHVHTRRSDGTGTVDAIAEAASRAGLRFVIFTDHGDGTREPEPPTYRHGVLCIEAVEISTDGGHLLALGLGEAPYRLGGEPRTVVEDVQRLGGLAVAAHPGSAKPELKWLEWTAPFDGLEWLNADSEWRDETPRHVARALLAYPGRGAPALATLLDRPEDVLRRWDALTRRRRVVAIAGADAHARLGLRSYGEPYDNAPALHVPTYEQMFRTFSNTLPHLQLAGTGAADAAALLRELRAGHVYSSIDALAAPAQLSFTATSGTTRVTAGDALSTKMPVTLQVDTNAPANAEIRLLENGVLAETARGPRLQRIVGPEPAVYRVEVQLAGSVSVPWIVSNPIYVRTAGEQPVAPPRAPAKTTATQYDDGRPAEWRIEKSARSTAALDLAPAVGGGTQLLVRYGLGGTAEEGPFVALVMPSGPLASYDRIAFTAHADRPMRLSVQLRVPKGGAGERWARSVYVDQVVRDVTVFFDDMTPRGFTTTRRPVLADVASVLFVVDTVNTKPGTSGQFWIDDVKYGR